MRVLENHQLISLTERDFSFLKACGEDACCWLAEFQNEETLGIRHRLSVALDTVKRYDLKGGEALLAAIDQEIRGRDAGLLSVDNLLQRFRFTTLAYLHYLAGDLAKAKLGLLKAHDEIQKAISRHGFLIPVAIHCTDFIIQRARIARRECQWREAQRYIWMIRDIYSDIRPLCVLDSGRPIRLPDIREFYSSLPLDEEQQDQARRFVGDAVPVSERVEYLEEMVFSLPDVVIPYP
jgi:hypothetical protein